MLVRPQRRRFVTLVAMSLLPGCYAITDLGGDSSTGDPGSTGAATTGLLPTTAPPPDPSTSSSSGGTETTADESSGGDPGGCNGFICDPDGGPHEPIECEVMEQDCPRGQKCNAWANDGGNAWNATRCFPIDADPDAVGEPCTVEGSGVSGVDSCDGGSICWGVDARTQEGECVPYCTGTPSAPTCEDASRICNIAGSGVLALCLAGCDPLDARACHGGASCLPIDTAFGCVPDASGRAGAAFDTCEYLNACDPGLICVDATVVGACEPGAARCCTPFCDLTAPVCPEPTVCAPYFEEGSATPGYESLGVCGSEPA